MRIILGFTRSDRAADYSSFGDGYRPGAEQRALTVTVPDAPAELSVEQWAEAVFVASNAPAVVAGEDPAVAALRTAMVGKAMRSLSVGDTVTVEGETIACQPTGWEKVEPAGTWTFLGHWRQRCERDRIVVTHVEDGQVDDDRIDTGQCEGGLWAAAASGPSAEVAEHIAVAEYEED